MPIQITNTLTGKKETFVPLTSGNVRMYVCGPTVYNFTHIGNARPAVFFDVVHRFLEFSGYSVERVANYTDVDDKILARANEEGLSPQAIAEKYITAYRADLDALSVRPAQHLPRVSQYIPQIIQFIERLVANGSAYVASDGEVFFSVRKFVGYGKLSGKNIDDLLSGARVAPDEKKNDPLDFSLWKPKKPGEKLAWKSPWAEGRPGWHIECSAMALQLLGESFEIHGGGMDLIHPHHENEIAQSEACTHRPFVKYWMHSNMLSFNAEKMSKSLGNVLLTKDFIKTHSAEVLRFLLLSGHYRSVIDYSDKHLRDCKASLHRIYSTLRKVATGKAGWVSEQPVGPSEAEFETALAQFEIEWPKDMADDFNTAAAISRVFDLVRAANGYFDRKGFKPSVATIKLADKMLAQIAKFGGVINLLNENPGIYLASLQDQFLQEKGVTRAEIEGKLEQRRVARQLKDFTTSDKVRDELLALGIQILDKGDRTEWDVSV